MTEKIEYEQYAKIVEEIKGRLQDFCKRVDAQIGAPCVELVSNIRVPLAQLPQFQA